MEGTQKATLPLPSQDVEGLDETDPTVVTRATGVLTDATTRTTSSEDLPRTGGSEKGTTSVTKMSTVTTDDHPSIHTKISSLREVDTL